MKAKKTPAKADPEQLARFKKMARELGADESVGALDQAFARLDMKKKEIRQPARPKQKGKNSG